MVVISGKMKWALLRVLASSFELPFGWTWFGRSFERREREKKDCCGGGGRLRMDFPGVGIVTADDEGEG